MHDRCFVEACQREHVKRWGLPKENRLTLQERFRQVSRQIRSGGTDQPWRTVSSSGDGEHIAESGNPLDMDRPSTRRGHGHRHVNGLRWRLMFGWGMVAE